MTKQWWYSQDEERWNGPCDSREEAIAVGRGDYGDESFMVMDAEQGYYDLTINSSQILELIEEQNEDESDPEGNNTFTEKLTPKQRVALESVINSAIERWVVDEKVDARAWAPTMGNPETIGETDGTATK